MQPTHSSAPASASSFLGVVADAHGFMRGSIAVSRTAVGDTARVSVQRRERDGSWSTCAGLNLRADAIPHLIHLLTRALETLRELPLPPEAGTPAVSRRGEGHRDARMIVNSQNADARYPVPAMPLLGVIATHSWHAAWDMLDVAQAGDGSAVWPAASRAIFVPFELPQPRTVTQLAWFNGSVVSGNVDAGIYDLAGNRLRSAGAAAQAGTSTLQVADITDITLQPGVYYMGLVLDNVTGTIFRWGAPSIQWLRAIGMQQMASAYPLPDPVTFANPATAYIPRMTVAFRGVI